MYPVEYVVIYAIICIAGIAAKPPYGDNRSSDYKYYEAAGNGQDGDVPRNMPSYPYDRAPAASAHNRRYRDEYRPREKNPYRRYHQHEGRPYDHNEYNRYDSDYLASTPPPATPPSPTPKPTPQQNNINADILTVKEIRIGPWKIYNNADGDGNHLVIVDSTADNDNHIIVDSDGTLHVNELTIDTDWTLRQEGSNMVIRDNTGGNNRLALARGLGTCWTLDGTCQLTLNALTVVKNWLMTEDQGSLIVKNVNNANDRLQLSPGMGPWTLDNTRTMDLNTINVGPQKKWVIRQETVPVLSAGTQDILKIRDVIGPPASADRAEFTFDQNGAMSTNAVNLKPIPVVSGPTPGIQKAVRMSKSEAKLLEVATFDQQAGVEVPTTTTSVMTIDASGEMLIKGIKVGEDPNLWAIRVADTTNALILQDLVTPDPLPNNHQAVFMPGLLNTCWTFGSTCSLTLNALNAQSATITTLNAQSATIPTKLTLGASGNWEFVGPGAELVLHNSVDTSNRMEWYPGMGAVTWDSARSLALNNLYIGPTSQWGIHVDAPDILIIRDLTQPTSLAYDHRLALYPGMASSDYH